MSGKLGDLRGRVQIADDGATKNLKSVERGIGAVSDAVRRAGSGGMLGGLSSALGKARRDLDAMVASSQRFNTNLSQYAANLARSGQHHLGRLGRAAAGPAAAAQGAGLSVRGIVDNTRQFQESKFGYGFARITDYIKDGSFQIGAWRKDMEATANEARAMAKAYGTVPDVAMKAREEVEKLGFKGHEAKSMFGAALGLHLSEPGSLPSGEAAKYMGAVYRAFSKEREAAAKEKGVDPNDPEFVKNYIKGIAAKTAVAGTESSLGPADVVEGMRQFAPQWASMGMSLEDSLAFLAHGANMGFRAPELGTAAKSMMTKIINPTAQGLNIYNLLGIDRSKFMTAAAVDPGKATNSINTLLSGSLYSGKGGGEKKSTIRQMLDTGYKQGIVTSPEFQQELSNEVMRMLPKGWEGRMQEVQQAVSNATISGSGGANTFGLIKAMRDAGATIGQIAQAFEGRHVARYTPAFQEYESMVKIADKLRATGGEVMDAVVQGRKESETGRTDQAIGSWQNLMLELEKSGGIIDKVKGAFIGFNETLAGLPVGALTALTAGLAALGALGAVGAVASGTRMVGNMAGLGSAGAAGAAGAAAQAAKPGMLRRIGGRLWRFVPGVGWMALGAGLLYGASKGYGQTGDVKGAVKGALDEGVGLPMDGPSSIPAIEPPSIGETRLARQRRAVYGDTPAATNASAGSDTSAALWSEISAALRAGGQEMTAALSEAAGGIRGGGRDVASALADAANSIRAAAQLAAGAAGAARVPLNTGRGMGAAPTY